MDYHKEITDFIEDNHSLLLILCKSYCRGTQLPPNDLLSELIIYLYDKEHKIAPLLLTEKDYLIKFSKKWLWNNTKLFTKNKGLSNFKSKFQILNSPDIDLHPQLQLNEMLFTEEELDLLNEYNIDQVRKIIFTRNYIKKLDDIERRLYKMHFEDKMSHVKISKYLQEKFKTKVSPSSIYNMLVELRQKIKMEYERNNN